MEKLISNFASDNLSIGRACMLLAMAISREQENELKNIFLSRGYRCGVTEVGGSIEEFRKKLYKSVIGASINNNVIERTSREIHAILHATQEAEIGLTLSTPKDVNLAVKIAIIRNNGWLCVGIYGLSAMHSMTNHERAGLGVMHI